MNPNQWIGRCSGGLLAAALAAGPGIASADEAELKAQIRELAAKIEALQAQQKALDARQAERATTPSAAAPAPSGEYVSKGDIPGSFKIPGTDTSLKIGGFARLDVVKDIDGGAFGSIAIPSLIPFSNAPQNDRRGQFGMNARQSRLYVRTHTPTSLGAITTHIEGDFIGAGGNESVTNSSGFRLRHAYAELGPWLVGQTWTNFVDLATYPETIDFAGGQALVQGIRAAQVRYTTSWGKAHQLSVAAENPESDIFGTVTTTMSAGVSPTSTTTLDKAPDINAKYTYSGDWGRVSLGGLVRHLTLNNKGGAPINGFVGESSTTTGAWAVQAKVNTFGKDSIQLSAAGGAGVGRYVLGAVNNTAAVINKGDLEGIHQEAYSAGYRHFWTPTLRSNVIYGQVQSDYPHPAIPLTTASKIEAIFVNLIWAPIQNGFIGLEWERGKVKNDAGKDGKNDRVLLSFQYGF